MYKILAIKIIENSIDNYIDDFGGSEICCNFVSKYFNIFGGDVGGHGANAQRIKRVGYNEVDFEYERVLMQV